uniref:hypothetical protein n=1 Tax=Paracoccus shandongensis TaxID=2816048 RepID=UPI001A90C724
MRELAPPLSRGAGFAPGLLTGLAALGDILLLKAWLAQDLLMITVMALHLCLALAFGGLSWVTNGRSASPALAGTAILALFGPFGGPVLMMIGPGAAPRATRTAPGGRPP